MGEDDLLEPEESEETIADDLGFADEEGVTEEIDVEEGGEETVEDLEGEAEVEEDAGEGEEEGEEAGYIPSAAEVGPPEKAKSDIYSAMLIISFLCFGTACWLAGAELHEYYGWTMFGMLK